MFSCDALSISLSLRRPRDFPQIPSVELTRSRFCGCNHLSSFTSIYRWPNRDDQFWLQLVVVDFAEHSRVIWFILDSWILPRIFGVVFRSFNSHRYSDIIWHRANQPRYPVTKTKMKKKMCFFFSPENRVLASHLCISEFGWFACTNASTTHLSM